MGDTYTNGIPEKLAISSRRSEALVIIAVSGELDMSNAEQLDEAIREAERGDCETIFVDLREVGFMDSTGLSMLLEAHRRSDRIRIVPSNHDAVTRLISLTATEEVFGYPGEPEPLR
jgi:anti-anti-sigma factor